MNQEPIKIVDQLCVELGITPEFYKKIHTEDDWSFIIKLHAIIEAAITHLLTKTHTLAFSIHEIEKYDEFSLSEAFTKLPLGDKRSGKAVLCKALGIIEPYQEHFINQLSLIRNRFAHDLKSVDSKLEAYLSKLDSNQMKNFIDGFGLLDIDHLKNTTGKDFTIESFVKQNPKISIWLSSFVVLSEIAFCLKSFHLRRDGINLKEKFANEFLRLSKIASELSVISQ